MDEIRPLMEVRSPEEAEEICEVLRGAGIKCNYALVPRVNDALASLKLGSDCLEVFVRDSDMDRAREVVAARQPEQAPG